MQIGPIKAGLHYMLGRDGELGGHIELDLLGRRGGQQQDQRDIQLLAVLRQLEVIGPEVVAPFGDTVRLIDHQHRQGDLLNKLPEAFVFKAFNRDHQDLGLARAHIANHLLVLRRGQGGIDARGGNTLGL